ncbi:MAG: aminotransferase class IV, partial [Candidatus Puniceispirillaceae bacterium]
MPRQERPAAPNLFYLISYNPLEADLTANVIKEVSMSRIAYVNGRYLAHSQASVHVEDRGYQFGDGIYEVVLVINGQPVDYDGHLERLYKSLNSIRMNAPISDAALRLIIARMIRLNQLVNGTIYVQITRGVARRDHKFP